ncbi:MAG: ribonuclease P protein component [Spirochaetaceae bacterium]|nr:ribonuclease P protein component [Spirochaetaceae bacterium]
MCKASGQFCFPRAEHLKKRADISAVFKKGKKTAGGGAVLFCKANGLETNRIAFTFAKKFGNAVKRNRARRLGREAYRHLRGALKSGYDIVLLVYPQDRLDFSGSAKRLKMLFRRAGLLKETAQSAVPAMPSFSGGAGVSIYQHKTSR